ncbi:hypothetical protein QE152_g17961 [Popillia japonica]|uniref:Uncharacterized protein n=1 Tax=Popillia japonica TaxID=7064 RepID=A0AAW1L552_POPJA
MEAGYFWHRRIFQWTCSRVPAMLVVSPSLTPKYNTEGLQGSRNPSTMILSGGGLCLFLKRMATHLDFVDAPWRPDGESHQGRSGACDGAVLRSQMPCIWQCHQHKWNFSLLQTSGDRT